MQRWIVQTENQRRPCLQGNQPIWSPLPLQDFFMLLPVNSPYFGVSKHSQIVIPMRRRQTVPQVRLCYHGDGYALLPNIANVQTLLIKVMTSTWNSQIKSISSMAISITEHWIMCFKETTHCRREGPPNQSPDNNLKQSDNKWDA